MKRTNLAPLRFTPNKTFGVSSELEWYHFINKGIDPDGYEVKFINSDIGKGVFATKLKRSGTFLFEYHGELITREEGLRREKRHPLRFGSFLFFFNVGRKEYCVDATFSKNPGRFVNDGIGQDRNAEARVVFIKKVPHIAIFAVKNILPGQEIRYDYGVKDLPWRNSENRQGSTQTIPAVFLCDIVKHPNCKVQVKDVVQQKTIKNTTKGHSRRKQRKATNARNTKFATGRHIEREKLSHVGKFQKTDEKKDARSEVERNHKGSADSENYKYDNSDSKNESSIVNAENIAIDMVSASREKNLNICQFQKTDGTAAARSEVEKDLNAIAISKHGVYDKSDSNNESPIANVENTCNDTNFIDVVSAFGEENLNICQFEKTDETDAARSEVERNDKEFAVSKHSDNDKSDSLIVHVENIAIDMVSIDDVLASEETNLNVCLQKTDGTVAARSEVERNLKEFAISKHGDYKKSDSNNESPIANVENICNDTNSIDVVSAIGEENHNIFQFEDILKEAFSVEVISPTNSSVVNAENMVSVDVISASEETNLNVCQLQVTVETIAARSEGEKKLRKIATSKHGEYDKIDSNNEPSLVDLVDLANDMASIDVVSSCGEENLNICKFQKTNAGLSEGEINCKEMVVSKFGDNDKCDASNENRIAEDDNLTLVRETQPVDAGTIVFRVCRNSKVTDTDYAMSVNNTAHNLNQGSAQQERKKGKKPYRPCPFCLKYKSKLKNHLESEHKNQKEVKDAKSLPPLERMHAFANLRKLGIYKENIRLIREKGSEDHVDLIRERRQGEYSPIMCVGCKAFVSKKQFYRHRKVCNNVSFSSPPRSLDPRFLASMKKNKFYATYQSEVLSRFRGDDVGELCREDPYITAYGYHKFLAIGKRKRKKDEKRKSLMSVMRRVSKLYIDFKAIKKDGTTDSADMFLRENKDLFKETIYSRKAASNADSNLMDGFTIKKYANFLHDMFADNGDDDRVDQTSKFLRTLSYNWRELFGESESEVLINRSHSRKPTNLPAEEDVKKLRTYILRSLKTMTSDTYRFIAEAEFTSLRDLLVSRLTLFNARRGGEPSRLTLDEWEDAKNDVWLDKLNIETKNPEDLNLLQEFKVSYQAGKNDGKLVPVIFPDDCIDGIKLLTDKSIRKDAGVHPSNVYLFPRIHLSEFHVIGTASIDSICRRAGVKPITATKMRHRAATIYADQDVDQRERQAFFTHMGHGDTINKHVYQCPPAFLEVTKVGKFLRHLDKVSETGETPSESTSGCLRVQASVTETPSESTSGFSRVPASVTVSNSEETPSESTSGCSRISASVTVSENGETSSESINGSSRVQASVTALGMAACTSQHRHKMATCSSQRIQQLTSFTESESSTGTSCQNEENVTNECNENHLLTARKENSLRASEANECAISSTNDTLHGRQYIRWSKEDTAKINSYFSKYVYDVSRFDKRGILPGYTEIRRFLKQYPDLLSQLPLDLKLKTIHTKLFNERNKSRRIAEKKIPQSS